MDLPIYYLKKGLLMTY